MPRSRPAHWWIAAASLTLGLVYSARSHPATSADGAAPEVVAETPTRQTPRTDAREAAPRASDARAGRASTDDRRSLDDLRRRDLKIPVSGVDADDLRPSFHDTRDGSREHQALDILAPRYTPVVAVENGTIAKLFLSNAGGKTIYQFDPTDTYAYYYAHLEQYAPGLTEGERVERGQQLGTVGTSGNAPPDTPHLHFGIFRLTEARQWWKGTPLDPFEVWSD